MVNHTLIRNFVLQLLLEEKKGLSHVEIYDRCKKKYSRSTSTVLISNILGKNRDIVKTGHVKVKRFADGYQLISTWAHRKNIIKDVV